jgi:hypothetical protein
MLLTLAYFCLGYFQYIFFYWIYYYFGQVRRVGFSQSAKYTTIVFVTMGIMMPLGGWISDRLTRRYGARIGRRLVPMVGLSLGALLLVAGTIVPGTAAAVLSLSLATGFASWCEGPFWASAIEVAGNGYINIRLDRGAFAQAALSGVVDSQTYEPGKVIVEHTNINPNKAAHIGHLRNAILGDTLVRLLRAAGYKVDVQNYIDNTGVQVADVVVGFTQLEKMGKAQIEALITSLTRFDYYCWDLYARVSQWYAKDKANLKVRLEALQAIEQGGNEMAEIADVVSTAVLRRHLQTMDRLDIEYDFLPRESEILHLHFWDLAFQLLKEKGVLYFETEGKKWNCVWVPLYSPDRRVKLIVKSFNLKSEVEVNLFLQRPAVTGIITNEIHSLRSGEREKLEQSYPGVDFSNMLILDEGRSFPDITKMRILAIGDAVRTDLASAQGLGVDGLLIAAGIHSDALLADGAIDPARLAALFAPPGTPPAIAAMMYLRW